MHSQNVPEDHLKGDKPASEKPAPENDEKISASADNSASTSVFLEEDPEIKLSTINGEMKTISHFLQESSNKFFNYSVIDISQIASCVDDFKQGLDSYMMKNFSQPELPERRIKKLVNFQLSFLNNLLLIEKDLSQKEKKEILKGFEVLGSICLELGNAFYKFGQATRTWFGIKSNTKWKKLKEEIKGSFLRAKNFGLLEPNLLVELDLLNVEKIVESLNADVRQFTDDVLKI